jgi:hypothetical protein
MTVPGGGGKRFALHLVEEGCLDDRYLEGDALSKLMEAGEAGILRGLLSFAYPLIPHLTRFAIT